MAYQVEKALKRRARAVGVTVVQMAQVVKEPPSTLASRLNGFSQLRVEQRQTIEAFLTAREKEIQAEESAPNGIKG